MTRLTAIIFGVIISGCAMKPLTYSPGNLPESTLAKVSVEDIGAVLDGGELFSQYMKVWDSEGEEVAKHTFWSSIPQTLFLEAGRYQILVQCSNTNGLSSGVYSYGRIFPELEASKEYIVYCLSRTEKNFIGMNMIKQMFPFVAEATVYEEERKKNQELIQNMDVKEK